MITGFEVVDDSEPSIDSPIGTTPTMPSTCGSTTPYKATT
jgi:hypothetical protein